MLVARQNQVCTHCDRRFNTELSCRLMRAANSRLKRSGSSQKGACPTFVCSFVKTRGGREFLLSLFASGHKLPAFRSHVRPIGPFYSA